MHYNKYYFYYYYFIPLKPFTLKSAQNTSSIFYWAACRKYSVTLAFSFIFLAQHFVTFSWPFALFSFI